MLEHAAHELEVAAHRPRLAFASASVVRGGPRLLHAPEQHVAVFELVEFGDWPVARLRRPLEELFLAHHAALWVRRHHRIRDPGPRAEAGDSSGDSSSDSVAMSGARVV